eukprot:1963728-Pyramimonas_sp.AAC.1
MDQYICFSLGSCKSLTLARATALSISVNLGISRDPRAPPWQILHEKRASTRPLKARINGQESL